MEKELLAGAKCNLDGKRRALGKVHWQSAAIARADG
jgi:hypothetical protein